MVGYVVVTGWVLLVGNGGSVVCWVVVAGWGVCSSVNIVVRQFF